jgi:AcrR family transcriptional regulator
LSKGDRKDFSHFSELCNMRSVDPAPNPAENLAARLRQAFLDHGYEQMTMSGLAQLCGFSRRALYHHFSNKEEAFRYFLEFYNEESVAKGIAAGRRVMEAGGSAVDVIVETVNVRYGDARRRLSRSPHALEINDQAFRRSRDIMIATAIDFQDKVAEMLGEMEQRRLLKLAPGVTTATLAQSLCDGARGTNQALPPIPIDELPARYRRMVQAILFGAASLPAARGKSGRKKTR